MNVLVSVLFLQRADPRSLCSTQFWFQLRSHRFLTDIRVWEWQAREEVIVDAHAHWCKLVLV